MFSKVAVAPWVGARMKSLEALAARPALQVMRTSELLRIKRMNQPLIMCQNDWPSPKLVGAIPCSKIIEDDVMEEHPIENTCIADIAVKHNLSCSTSEELVKNIASFVKAAIDVKTKPYQIMRYLDGHMVKLPGLKYHPDIYEDVSLHKRGAGSFSTVFQVGLSGYALKINIAKQQADHLNDSWLQYAAMCMQIMNGEREVDEDIKPFFLKVFSLSINEVCYVSLMENCLSTCAFEDDRTPMEVMHCLDEMHSAGTSPERRMYEYLSQQAGPAHMDMHGGNIMLRAQPNDHLVVTDPYCYGNDISVIRLYSKNNPQIDFRINNYKSVTLGHWVEELKKISMRYGEPFRNDLMLDVAHELIDILGGDIIDRVCILRRARYVDDKTRNVGSNSKVPACWAETSDKMLRLRQELCDKFDSEVVDRALFQVWRKRLCACGQAKSKGYRSEKSCGEFLHTILSGISRGLYPGTPDGSIVVASECRHYGEHSDLLFDRLVQVFRESDLTHHTRSDLKYLEIDRPTSAARRWIETEIFTVPSGFTRSLVSLAYGKSTVSVDGAELAGGRKTLPRQICTVEATFSDGGRYTVSYSLRYVPENGFYTWDRLQSEYSC